MCVCFVFFFFFFLMLRRPPRSTQGRSSAASVVYKRRERSRERQQSQERRRQGERGNTGGGDRERGRNEEDQEEGSDNSRRRIRKKEKVVEESSEESSSGSSGSGENSSSSESEDNRNRSSEATGNVEAGEGQKEKQRILEMKQATDDFYQDQYDEDCEEEEERVEKRRSGEGGNLGLKGQPVRVTEQDKSLQRAMQRKEDDNKFLRNRLESQSAIHQQEMQKAIKLERNRADRRVTKLENQLTVVITDIDKLFARTRDLQSAITTGSQVVGTPATTEGIIPHVIDRGTNQLPGLGTELSLPEGEEQENTASGPEANAPEGAGNETPTAEVGQGTGAPGGGGDTGEAEEESEDKLEGKNEEDPDEVIDKKKKRKRKGDGGDPGRPVVPRRDPPDSGGGTGGEGGTASEKPGTDKKRGRSPESQKITDITPRPKRANAGKPGKRKQMEDCDSEDNDWRDSTENWIREQNGSEREAKGKMAGWPAFLEVRGVFSINLEGLRKRDKSSWRKRFIRKLYKLGKRTPQVKTAVNEIKRAFRKYGWFKDRDLWDDPGVKEAIAATRYSLEEYKAALTIKARKEKYPMHLEALSEMHDRLRPYDVVWDNPWREDVDRALLFLLAVMLFDIGMRIGMATLKKVRNLGKPNSAAWKPPPAKIPGRSETTKGEEPLQKVEEGEDSEEDSDSEEEAEVKEKTDPILSHTFVLEDLEFAVLDKSGMVRMIRGGRKWIKELRKNDNHWVLWFRVTFETAKTTNLRKHPKLPRPAVMGRRSPIESRALDLLLDFLRWRGPVAPRTPLLSRPPLKGRNNYMGGWKTVGSTELVKWVKEMARRHNVRDSHVSAISFRKGHVTTVLLLTMKERADAEAGLQAAIDRAGKWAKGSGVPKKHYLTAWEDRGPLALIQSWEEGIPIGKGFEGWRIRQPA